MPKQTRRLLDPVDRISEVLFGLIMALSFTCSMNAAEAGHEDVRALLIGALGCNIAWGLIDAVIFLMTNLTERARGIATLRALGAATTPLQVRNIISGELPPLVAETLTDQEFETLRHRLGNITEPPSRPKLGRDDFLAALGVFLLVFLATFPVVIPFIAMREAVTALRISNAIALVMLFLAGLALGRYAQYRPLRMGVTMMLIGTGLVMLTIVLGG